MTDKTWKAGMFVAYFALGIVNALYVFAIAVAWVAWVLPPPEIIVSLPVLVAGDYFLYCLHKENSQ